MAYRAFLDPNKPCFLQELYFLPIDNLQNERSLFEVYNFYPQITTPLYPPRPEAESPHQYILGHHRPVYHWQSDLP